MEEEGGPREEASLDVLLTLNLLDEVEEGRSPSRVARRRKGRREARVSAAERRRVMVMVVPTAVESVRTEH